jgi:hypothetical protein
MTRLALGIFLALLAGVLFVLLVFVLLNPMVWVAERWW